MSRAEIVSLANRFSVPEAAVRGLVTRVAIGAAIIAAFEDLAGQAEPMTDVVARAQASGPAG